MPLRRRSPSPPNAGSFLVFSDPVDPDFADAAVNLGVQWATTEAGLWIGNRVLVATSGPGGTGSITAAAYNEDTHTLLASQAATAVAGAEQVIRFATPVAVVPGVNYLAAYHTDLRYAFQAAYAWPAASADAKLTTPGANAGRFLYAAGVAEPTNVTAVNFYVSPVVRF